MEMEQLQILGKKLNLIGSILSCRRGYKTSKKE